jgi:hypothetical protein
MPSFGINTNRGERDSGEVRGKIYNIACKVWFPTNNKPYPLSFKFEGDDGIIATVSELNVKHTEDKIYYGEKSIEYRCDAIIGGFKKDIKIIYYVLNCKWVMVLF